MNVSSRPTQTYVVDHDDVQALFVRFARGVESLTAMGAEIGVDEMRARAIHLLHPIFRTWAQYEVERSLEISPLGIIGLRLCQRSSPELALFRFANFPDASRLLRKDFCDRAALERADEVNPGAPPAMHCVYERTPQARGPFEERDRPVIEALDYAALQIPCVDVVHQRTAAACDALVPRILRSLRGGRDFFLLDVACGGNRLGRTLRESLRAAEVDEMDLARVHILGVDVDERAPAYTFRECGLDGIAWCSGDGSDVDVTIVRGNLFDLRTEEQIARYLQKRGRNGFDAVTALGIFDYFDCPLPDEAKVYIPAALAAPLAQRMRSYAIDGGVVIAAVFAAEDPDPISTGARHLFANWHIKHASEAMFRRWFFFAKPEEIGGIPGVDAVSARRAHFVVHECDFS